MNQCPNGCGAAVGPAEIANHRSLCPKQLFPCRYKCKQFILRENLPLHYKQCPNVKITCPDCRALVLRGDLSSHKSSCTTTCPNGCKILREELPAHSTTCPKEIIVCPDGCKKSIMRKDLLQHQNDCPKVKLCCPNGCGTSLLRKNLLKHQLKCLAMVFCTYGCKVQKRHLDVHYSHCPKAVVSCPNGCEEELNAECPNTVVVCPNGCQVLKKELSMHNAECPRAVVSCPNGCMVPRLCLDEHKLQCPNRPINCPNGCQTIITSKMLTEHQRSCPEVKISCPNGCGAILFRKNTSTHNMKCKKAFIACPNGCGATLLQKKISNHNLKCKKVVIACPNGCEVLRKELSSHNAVCPKEVIVCDCKASMLREHQTSHLLTCPKAVVKCPKGCSILREELSSHSTECPEQCILCPTGCTAFIRRKNFAKHICPKANITCPNGCGVVLLQEDLPRHLCPKAAISCPNGCKELVTREDVLKHIYYDCPEVVVLCSTCCNTPVQRQNIQKHENICRIFSSARNRASGHLSNQVNPQSSVTIARKYAQKHTISTTTASAEYKKVFPVVIPMIKSTYNKCSEEAIVPALSSTTTVRQRTLKRTGWQDMLMRREDVQKHSRSLYESDIILDCVAPEDMQVITTEYLNQLLIDTPQCRHTVCGDLQKYVSSRPVVVTICETCDTSRKSRLAQHYQTGGRYRFQLKHQKNCLWCVKKEINFEKHLGIRCPEGCGRLLLKKDLKAHKKTSCPEYGVVSCPCCYKLVKRNKLSQHLSHSCLLSRCPYGCGQDMTTEDVARHVGRCPDKIIACRSCGMKLKKRSLNEHLEHHCKSASHKKCCNYGCGKSIPKDDFPGHEKACDELCIVCPQECGMRVLKRKFQQHLKRGCRHSNTDCPTHCGLRLKKSEVQRHLKEACPQASIACTNGCGVIMLRRKVEEHLRTACTIPVFRRKTLLNTMRYEDTFT